jgi:hypothetical protein
MGKYFLIMPILAVVGLNIYAQGGRQISMNYQHSRRVSHNTIDIELGSENNSGKIYYLKTLVKGNGENEESIIESIINIDKEYFDKIYSDIINIDFKEILLNNESIVGLDGRNIKIIVGTSQNNLILNLWSPGYKSEERKTEVLYSIIQELFFRAGLGEWL